MTLSIVKEGVRGEIETKAESHIPRIIALEVVKAGELFEVGVEVGPHPNIPQHSIRRIELYFMEEGRPLNPVRVASVELEPVYSEPRIKVRARVGKPSTLYALAYCNLHGIWEASRGLKVEG